VRLKCELLAAFMRISVFYVFGDFLPSIFSYFTLNISFASSKVCVSRGFSNIR
jgi:hypothetical protein